MSRYYKNVFPVSDDAVFFGTESLRAIISETEDAREIFPNTIVVGGRNKGKTELIKRLYNNIFRNYKSIIPFYFAIPCIPYENKLFYLRYLNTIVKQFAGFINKEPAYIHRWRPFNELLQSIDDRYIRIRSLFKFLYDTICDDSLRTHTSVFSLPLYISEEYGIDCALLMDDFHYINNFPCEIQQDIIREIERSSSSHHSLKLFITSIHVKHVSGLFSSSFLKLFKVYNIDALSDCDSKDMWKHYCKKQGVSKDDLSVIFSSFSNNPFYIKVISDYCQKKGGDSISVAGIYILYIEQVGRGNISLFFSSILSIIPSILRKPAIILCNELANKGTMEHEKLNSFINCEYTDYYTIIKTLNMQGIIYDRGSKVSIWDDYVIKDYFSIIFLTEIEGKDFDKVKGSLVLKKLEEFRIDRDCKKKRCSIEELKALVGSFSGQMVPNALFNYQLFRNELRVDKPDHIQEEFKKGDNGFHLPEPVGMYEDIFRNRSLPFVILTVYCCSSYSLKDEVWIVGYMLKNKDMSVEEANLFVNQADIISERAQEKRAVRWVVSPKGFNEDTLSVLQAHSVLTSSLAQICILGDIIKESKSTEGIQKKDSYTFELLLPIGEETELVASKTVEEIAKRGNFDENSAGQIKMCIIEACLNAFEYTFNKKSAIKLTFNLNKDRLVIYIENEGWGVDTSLISEPKIENKIYGNYKRGWGLKIMKNLMDEVRFEKVKNYTRLILIKYVTSAHP